MESSGRRTKFLKYISEKLVSHEAYVVDTLNAWEGRRKIVYNSFHVQTFSQIFPLKPLHIFATHNIFKGWGYVNVSPF